MKQLSYIFLYILCILILQCSGNEKSKIVDIYPDGSPKEIEGFKIITKIINNFLSNRTFFKK